MAGGLALVGGASARIGREVHVVTHLDLSLIDLVRHVRHLLHQTLVGHL